MSDQRSGFIPRLEALRGIFAVLVGFYHAGQALLPDPPEGLARLYMGISNGIGCVIAFFVISGFVLARSLDRTANFQRFLHSRLFRLFPAIVATVLLFTAVYLVFGVNIYRSSFAPFNVLLNMITVHTDIDRVMWSMKVEVVATPLIFLWVLMVKRRGPKLLLSTILLLFGLSSLGQFRDLLGDGSNLSPLYAFPVGILLHFCGDAVARRFPPRLALVAVVAAVAVFSFDGSVTRTVWITLLDTIASAVIVLAVAQHHQRPDLFRPLDFGMVRFYGRISYSFYLLHPLALWLTVDLTQRLWLAGAHATVPVALAAAIASTLIATLPAYLMWRFVELRGVKLGRALAPAGRY